MVGASLAGLQAAETLRHEGFDGELVVIGAESHTPYDRPPLTKQLLLGDWEPDRLTLAAYKDDLGVTWRLGVAASGLDLASRRVALDDGTHQDADGVVIATGARARMLPGTEGISGVFTIRTLDDSLALRDALRANPSSVVVVGAGFIGAEVAATARRLGLPVTLVEPLATPLARVLGDEVGEAIAGVHRDEGVHVRTGVGVERVVANAAGRVVSVALTDGAVVDADVVVVGIGVIPNTEWLASAGVPLEADGGITCDAACRVAPGVVAAGDVASWPNPVFGGERMRVEHWDHAFEQGAHAARSLLAGESAQPHATVPWFWSDQYDRKIQLAGRPRADDEVAVVDGTLDDHRFVALYGRGGRLSAVLGMNRPRAVVQLRSAISDGIGFTEACERFA